MLLLQHGAAVDTATKDMYTALHIAAKEGQEEVITTNNEDIIKIVNFINDKNFRFLYWNRHREYMI